MAECIALKCKFLSLLRKVISRCMPFLSPSHSLTLSIVTVCAHNNNSRWYAFRFLSFFMELKFTIAMPVSRSIYFFISSFFLLSNKVYAVLFD
jgi:hypothetical protein